MAPGPERPIRRAAGLDRDDNRRVSLSILVVARWYPSHDLPGRGTFVADLVRALTATGTRVVVASFETTQFRAGSGDTGEAVRAVEAHWAAAIADPAAVASPTTWGAGVPVARLPVVRTWGSGPELHRVEQAERHAAVLQPFARALATRMPFDLIHAHTGLPDGVAAAAAADELGVPLLVTEHDSTLVGRLDADPGALAAYRRLLDGRRRVVAPSPSLASALNERLQPADPIGVIPNPVPMDVFRLGSDADRRADELLWVGARAVHKGTDRLIRAFALARAQRPDLRLRLIGASPDGDDRPWLRLADELGVADGVSIEPALDRAGVAGAMRRASLFVHPSPFETFGMVAAEALASGLPVAASPSGGVDAIVGSDGVAGQIAASLDAEDLAAAIAAALDRRGAFRPDALRARVGERYGASLVAAQTVAAYEELLGRDRPPAPAQAPSPDPRLDSGPKRAIAAVVALHRSGVSRVAALPEPARAGLTVVTNRAPARDLQDSVARVVIPVAPDGPTPALLGRLGRSIGRPAGGPPPDGGQAAAETQAIQSAAAVPAVDSWRVAADADDVEPIVRAVGAAVLAPGSIRWLADRNDELAAEPSEPRQA
jgi:glycosyltransferase involved in cell wall biosynthesis